MFFAGSFCWAINSLYDEHAQVESFEKESEIEAGQLAYDEDDLDEISPASSVSPIEELQRIPMVFHVNFLPLSDPDVALLRSVEIRNATHVIMLCGPRDSLSKVRNTPLFTLS